MGLDITALSAISRCENEEDGYHVWDGGFEGRLGTIAKGHYEAAPGADCVAFYAGSYGGYSRWRENLCRFVYARTPEAVWEDAAAGPFIEQIAFSDCDGSIGSEISAKLARDYAEWQPKIEEAVRALDAEAAAWFLECYANWRRVFECAARGGVVIFH